MSTNNIDIFLLLPVTALLNSQKQHRKAILECVLKICTPLGNFVGHKTEHVHYCINDVESMLNRL